MESLIKALKSMIVDIEAMQVNATSYDFGPFSEFTNDIESVMIEWPNLAISLEDVKKQLLLNHCTDAEMNSQIRGNTATLIVLDDVEDDAKAEAAAKRLEKHTMQTTYGWSDEQFETWWNKDPRFITQIFNWGHFSGTEKEKRIHEAKIILGLTDG